MQTLKVVNIKCGGCENTISSALKAKGFTNVQVDAMKQEISFEQGDMAQARKIMESLGYPPADSPAAKSFLKKAQSYASCMVGRIKK